MNNFAVFDIDGTLIRWQLYHAVVDRLAKKGLLKNDATDTLYQARMKWKNREHADTFHEYEIALIETFEAALQQLSPDDFDQAAKETTQEYADQVYTYTRDLMKDLKKRGYFLLAISGSHHELVTHIAKHYGFDAWQGTEYQRHEGRFSGQKFVASQNKESVLKSLVKKHNLTFRGSLAVGDSASDAPLLKLVEQPIAFNPDRALFKIAKQNGWPIVIERKNMIYRLEEQDGRYILS